MNENLIREKLKNIIFNSPKGYSLVLKKEENKYLLEEVENYCRKLNCYSDLKRNEKIYLFVNNIEPPICKCGSNKKPYFISVFDGYKNFCSRSCPLMIEERKKTCLVKYGVDNPKKSEIVKIKTKETCIKKYGVDNPSKSEIIKNKIKNKFVEKYGIDNPLKSEEVKLKMKKTLLEKYGVCHNMKKKEIREKAVQTFLKKYGVSSNLKSDYFRNKLKEIFVEKYGVHSPFKLKEVRNKIKKTNLERYGVDIPSKSEEIKSKFKQTCLEKYGVDNPFKSEEIKNKIKKTNLEKYGVDIPSKSEEIKSKFKQTCLEKYGVDNPLKSEEIKNKVKQTNLNRYGIDNPAKLEEIKNKMKKTNLEKYGVEYVSQKNISKELLEIFSDKEKTKDLIEKYTIEEISNIYNVSKYYILRKLLDLGLKNKFKSYGETEILNFLNNIGIKEDKILQNARKPLNNKYRIDIFIPEKNIGIEFCGLFWHSELAGKDKNYHINKFLEANTNNIKLVQIFRDRWIYKQDICKNRLTNILGISEKGLPARKLHIKEIDSRLAKDFTNKYHMQGHSNAKIYLGAFSDSSYNENSLVGILSLSQRKIYGSKIEKGVYRIVRFCQDNKTHPGLLSKFISYIKNNYKFIEKITTFSDLRWSRGDSYIQAEFKFIEYTKPNYWYFKEEEMVRYHRYRFRKDVILREFSITDKTKTEWEIMQENGWNRIWDAGNAKFEICF